MLWCSGREVDPCLQMGDLVLYSMGIGLFEGRDAWVGVCMPYSIDQGKTRSGELMQYSHD